MACPLQILNILKRERGHKWDRILFIIEFQKLEPLSSKEPPLPLPRFPIWKTNQSFLYKHARGATACLLCVSKWIHHGIYFSRHVQSLEMELSRKATRKKKRKAKIKRTFSLFFKKKNSLFFMYILKGKGETFAIYFLFLVSKTD
jgi:hypothetical protein